MKWLKYSIGAIGLYMISSFCVAGYLFESFFTREGAKGKPKKQRKKETAEANEDKSVWLPYKPFFDEGSNWFHSQNPETVTIQSKDGLLLTGYFLPCQDAKRTMILVHGYHGNGISDFGYVARFYYKLKSNILIIDQRTHGKSEGKYIGFGVKERYDCISWIRYVNERVGEQIPVFLDGVSMGATTVLLAAGLELPDNVAGIVADCGFTSAWEICKSVLKKQYHLPTTSLLYFADWICKIRAGYHLREVTTLQTVKKSKVPILFVHGDRDDFVPPDMSRMNYLECDSEKQLEIVKGAGHALSYFTDRSLCERKIKIFLESHDKCLV